MKMAEPREGPGRGSPTGIGEGRSLPQFINKASLNATLAVLREVIEPLVAFPYQRRNSGPQDLGTRMKISGGMQDFALVAACPRNFHFFVSFAELRQQLIACEHTALLKAPFWRKLRGVKLLKQKLIIV